MRDKHADWLRNQRRRSQRYGIHLGGKRKKKGCYIATAVYGSYDCEKVWVLRRYRDEALSRTFVGRMFISVYYAISPIMVKLFGKTTAFKKVFKRFLDKRVDQLMSKGYSGLPYKDN